MLWVPCRAFNPDLATQTVLETAMEGAALRAPSHLMSNVRCGICTAQGCRLLSAVLHAGRPGSGEQLLGSQLPLPARILNLSSESGESCALERDDCGGCPYASAMLLLPCSPQASSCGVPARHRHPTAHRLQTLSISAVPGPHWVSCPAHCSYCC